jgi:ankyrin repeat protein
LLLVILAIFKRRILKINEQPILTSKTSLHVAATKGNEAVMEKCITGRCNVDLQTTEEGTVLHLAAQQGYAAVTKQLHAARCNVTTSRLIMALLRCNLLSARGTPDLPR